MPLVRHSLRVVADHSPPSVIEISLPRLNLTGQIPAQLAASLPNLRRINLRGNSFSGPIPDQLFSSSSALRSILLYGNNLFGPLPPSVCNLPRLQSLVLSHNSLSGTIPRDFKNCTTLERLILAGNKFSGEVPAGIWAAMRNLTTLDLSDNKLTGSVPEDIGELNSLSIVLNLSHNHLTGSIPAWLAKLPPGVTVDLSYNNLTGEIDIVLGNRGVDAFANNPMLCGIPLNKSCHDGDDGRGRKIFSVEDIALILAAHFIFVLCVGFAAVYYYRKRSSSKSGSNGVGHHRGPDVMGCDGGDGVGGKLVALDKGFRCDIDELLQASAYVLGMNARGIVYKVVLGNGDPVVVRRLGSGVGNGCKEFTAEALAIGRVRHPNVVRVRAFYWTPDEKLLISDFISNGNLASALHGRSGRPSRGLSWSARLKIAKGAAAGLAFIHECSIRKFVHQNIKPANILLDRNLKPYISDFGLDRLISINSTTSGINNVSASNGITGGDSPAQHPLSTDKSNRFRAPESQNANNVPTQKWDVYSFGVVLLQLLTGRNPEVPQNELGLAKWARKGLSQGKKLSSMIDPTLLDEAPLQKGAMTLFELALACTEDDPEIRPKMKLVSENLEKIAK
uniref:Protein kinase domain-containing protein n=1 Tax=Kalanchoe fedtschenkoi TaxID=63787 RepID=A0A7N0UXU8_KALFE